MPTGPSTGIPPWVTGSPYQPPTQPPAQPPITGYNGYYIPPTQPPITGYNGYWIPGVPGGGWGVPAAGPTGGGAASSGGGSGGGGGNNTPAPPVPPPSWAVPGAPGQYNWLPWTEWQQAPWGNVPTANAQEQQAWMNVMLPWMQQSQQGQQWAQDFAQRQATEAWNQQFQGGQFDWQKQQDELNQALAQRQLEEQARAANIATYGRRWQPRTRWM